ncbi:MAG TPA: MerR family transcriptional regulator [Flavobacteriales bacterium]|nr:MerR family transcriptional regulator [Flavobacteriales bacterium]HCA83220.1 MerR family transcriptional regulator [Flavobacteriales bacterium]HRE75569.1 MerR family transcriptional regulator [Flavobacteriales bacterium]HRE97185.1 MerR family transcriptional regulator [Flavobacteriales bacterium]HRJ35179.1 MerR family transcriptional regulator [Flavobacteriales bacterium]
MPYKERPTQKLYYSIGEVAAMFGVNTSLIRFWEKEFDVIKPTKNKKGNRLFTAEDIENFKKIFTLVKGEGYTLQGAKEKIRELDHKEEELINDELDKRAVIEKLIMLKDKLRQIKDQL